MKYQKPSYVIVTGILVSIVSLWYAYGKISPDIFYGAFLTVKFEFVVACSFLIIVGVIFRSLRWAIISGKKSDSWLLFFHSSCIGYLGNMIFPARAGEILRIVYLSKNSDIDHGHAISGAVTDRISDGLAFLFFLGLIIIIFEKQVADTHYLIYPGILFVLLSLLLLLFVMKGAVLLPFMENMKIESVHRYKHTFANWYIGAHTGISTSLTAKTWPLVFILSLGAFFLDGLALWFLTQGYMFSLPVYAGLILMFFLSAGSLLPAAPGYLGTYQIACLLALKPFGVVDSESIAFSFTFQIINFIIFFFLAGGSMVHLFRSRSNINGEKD